MCFKDDETRFKELVYIYYDDIYRIISYTIRNHHTAQDMTQTVMEKAWKKFHTLKEPDKSKAWVKAIARNDLRTYMRKKKSPFHKWETVYISEVHDTELDLIESDIADALANEETISTVFDALEELPDRFSEIITMNILWEISLKEIAKINKMKEATVRAYYSQGMQKLREIYNILEKGGEYDDRRKK